MKSIARQSFLISSVFVVVAASAAIASAEPVAPEPPTEPPAVSDASCTDVDVVIARGTDEPGSLGILAGDPFYTALRAALPGKKMSAYAVKYPANLLPGSVQAGNTDLVNHVTAQAAACPDQKFVLMGYSQGANVVSNSIGTSSQGSLVGAPIVATIDAGIEPNIEAVVLFGSPNRKIGNHVTGTYEARTDDICSAGDLICSADIGGAHLFYWITETQNAAKFAAAQF